MTDLRKAVEQVLEAFDWDWSEPRNKALRERMKALRQALAQPEQEPVAYVTIEPALDGDWRKCPSIKWFNKPTEGSLYTAPPKREWIGLKDDDFNVKQVGEFDVVKFARYIEAILKERNCGTS